jgi:hypothetical protein
MNKDNIIFIGMDTHKDFCENAYCLDSRDSTPQPLGRITTTKLAITKLARQFQSKYPSATLHFAIEECLSVVILPATPFLPPRLRSKGGFKAHHAKSKFLAVNLLLAWWA